MYKSVCARRSIITIMNLLFCLSTCINQVNSTLEISRIKVPLFQFLPLHFTYHHFLVLSSNECKVILDFIPAQRSMNIDGTRSALLLIAGQSQPGIVRSIFLRPMESKPISRVLDAVFSNWDDEINIYSHNCQHFCDFVEERFRGSGITLSSKESC